MNLVVVESPAKAKTIEKYLGKDYKVLASFGHVRDLPKSDLGVDVENNYLPDYVIPDKAKKTIKQLKEFSKKADMLYLATDLDREGEAISWHLLEALGWKKDYYRITFSEITQKALQAAIGAPRKINMDLVDAQQARRILDRLVGYKLSPLLWKKIRRGLSAGRVQSVAVRLIVEKEKEIRNFKPIEYWQIKVDLSKESDKQKFSAMLVEAEGQKIGKLDVKNQAEADKIKTELSGASYFVEKVESKQAERRSSAPFTTSTLQMEASRKLGCSAKRTMSLAQKLYEDGKITYMRTDSTNISADAALAVRELVKSQFGAQYLPEKAQTFQTKTKRAQEAHEAIRPSDVSAQVVSEDPWEQKLYELIWKRTIASQMNNAIYDILEVTIGTKTESNYKFFTKGESLKFDGFMRVYSEGKDDEIEEEKYELPAMVSGDILKFWELFCNQKYTEPPKRYSEATLVKKLESLGIGRPSTYAPTLSTVQDRGYVKLVDKRFMPEEIGEIVNDLLAEHFKEIVDYDFTAKMEEEFDSIADGEAEWQKIIDAFYKPFAKAIIEKSDSISRDDFIKSEKTGEKCPECGEELLIKLGRYGKFIACSNYPKCKYSKPIESKDDQELTVVDENGQPTTVAEAEEEKCEKCGGRMKLKEGRFGKFLACDNYPECKNTKAIVKSIGIDCPDCKKGQIIQRKTKKGRNFWGCSNYPKCEYATWENPVKQESKADDADNTPNEA